MLNALFAQATAAHIRGDVGQAAALYQQILAIAPDHADALHLFGRLLCDHKRFADGTALLTRAVQQKPRVAEYLAALAEAQGNQGAVAASLESWRRAVRLKPESASLQFGHGHALAASGMVEPAIQAFRRAVARDPAMIAAHTAIGTLLLQAGRAAEAETAFAAAVRLRPDAADTQFNLGTAYLQQRKLAQAEVCFRTTAAAQPGHAGAIGNLGVTLYQAGRPEEAVVFLRQAADMQPDLPAAAANLGLALRAASRFDAAVDAMRRAVHLAPGDADMLCHLGNVLRDQGRLEESSAMMGAALACDGDNVQARFGLAYTQLICGRLAEGWPHFASRPAAKLGRDRVKRPLWDGGAFSGRLLVYAEQGAGDFLQVCRYVPLLAARGIDVALDVPPSLARLAASLEGVGAINPARDSCAMACADMDLPGLFGTTLESIPCSVPYLRAPVELVGKWRARLADLPGHKVGLAWAGNPAYFHDAQRSVPASKLALLAGVPGVTYVSLQTGAAAGAPAPLGAMDWTGELTDFAESAALITALDLTISVDSAVAHLAGALGRPVWLLNRYAPDWRWLLGRDDSPWYPTLRQFRQTEPGNWDAVLNNVRKAVAKEGVLF